MQGLRWEALVLEVIGFSELSSVQRRQDADDLPAHSACIRPISTGSRAAVS